MYNTAYKNKTLLCSRTVVEGYIQVKKVSSKLQVADIMTKPLFKLRIQVLVRSMGLEGVIS